MPPGKMYIKLCVSSATDVMWQKEINILMSYELGEPTGGQQMIHIDRRKVE
jgi:hypothetical protein